MHNNNLQLTLTGGAIGVNATLATVPRPVLIDSNAASRYAEPNNYRESG